MKSTFSLILFLWAASCPAQVTPGIGLGYGSSSFLQHNHLLSDYGITPHSVKSFHAGITADYSIGRRWLLLSDLLYFGGGGRLEGRSFPNQYPDASHDTLELHYLRLAVNGAFRFVKFRQFSVFAGPGFFVERGLNGTVRVLEPGANPGIPGYFYGEHRVDFTNEHSNYIFPEYYDVNPWDAGYTLLAGAAWKDWQLKAIYSHGLVRVYSVDGSDLRSQTFSLTAGWLWRVKRRTNGLKR